MPKQPLTPEQQQRQAEDIATAWRLTKCPKGLLDPTTGLMHPSSIQVIRDYLSQHHDLNTLMLDTLEKATEVFGKAIEATKHKLVWFSDPPPKAKKPKPPPKYEPPLRPCDARRVNREYHEAQEKQRQEAQKVIDKILEKAAKEKADERPAAVYYEGGPNSGKINWAATKKLQDLWDATHGNF